MPTAAASAFADAQTLLVGLAEGALPYAVAIVFAFIVLRLVPKLVRRFARG
jgi:hypothetical protein